MLYRKFFVSGLADNASELEEVSTSIGFISENMNSSHRRQALDLIRIAFEALRAPIFDFTDRSLTQRMQRGGEALARDGFVPPVLPMDVLYLQRKFGGMFLLGARLKVRLPVADIMRAYLAA